MRGAMMFEDFNYKLFNKYILVDHNNKNYEHIYEEERKLEENLKKIESNRISKKIK
jgi:hypothetical protein